MWLQLNHVRDGNTSPETSTSGARSVFWWVVTLVRNSIESDSRRSVESRTVPAPRTTEYRQKILDAQKMFRRHGVICEQGTWYFHRVRSTTLLREHIFDGQPLCSFPSPDFLSAAGIVTRQWSHARLTSLEHIKSLFTFLGLTVATREQERTYDNNFLSAAIPRYRTQLIVSSDLFRAVGVAMVWNRWYLWDVSGANSLLNIAMSEWQRFASFPSREFLYHHKIVSTEWAGLSSVSEIRHLLSLLWIPVASPEQEIVRWRELLYGATPDLERVGITCEKWVWYFHDMRCLEAKKVTVWGRKLKSFPNKKFLNEHGIIPAWQNAIQHARSFRQLFHALWLRVADHALESAHQETRDIPRFRQALLWKTDELLAAGLKCTDGVWWGFSRASLSMLKAIVVDGITLLSFPSTRFLMTHYVVPMSAQRMQSLDHVRGLFITLGIPVATARKEKSLWRAFHETQIPALRDGLLTCVDDLKSLGMRVHSDGTWDTSAIKYDVLLLAHIQWKPAMSYPSTRFLRDLGFISKKAYEFPARTALIEFWNWLWVRVIDT